MKKFFRIATLFILLLPHQSTAALINSISFEGLTKTKESYLHSIIKCKEGKEFEEKILKNDEQSLRNLNLFFSVQSTFEWNEPKFGWDIKFLIKEAKYLYPIFSISGFKTQFKLEAGADQINFRGKGESIGLVYQYYDRHSISGFYNAPRHKNGKTGHDFSATKYSTIEPLYFEDTVADFNFDNFNVSIGGRFWLGQKSYIGLGGMYMYEEYYQIDTAAFDLGQNEFYFHKYQLRSFHLYNGVDRNYERQNGLSNLSYFEMIQTKDYPQNSFLKFTNEFKWFKSIKKNGNFAFKTKLGISTNNESPFAPFVLDGFINVRGVGNRVMRGTAELIVNTEYRQTIWKHKFFTVQMVGFMDYGTLRQPGTKFVEMFTHKDMKLFLGGGFRFHSRILYNTSFRIDYSVSPMHSDQHGLTFGFGQFF